MAAPSFTAQASERRGQVWGPRSPPWSRPWRGSLETLGPCADGLQCRPDGVTLLLSLSCCQVEPCLVSRQLLERTGP